jgi:hypothetical protein
MKLRRVIMDILSDIYFDLKDLRNGHIAECYNNADELLDELIMKFEIYFEESKDENIL